jgi:sporulation and spore germination protein
MRLTPALPIAALCLAVGCLAAGCGGGDDAMLSLYFKQRLGTKAPPGQIAPVLMPVERRPRLGEKPGRQIVIDLSEGPTPSERARGFLDTIAPEVRFGSVTVRDGTAVVELARREPDFYGTAAIVYSLTELPDVERVELELDGRPCCMYRHDRTVVTSISRDTYRGWQGEPCGERDRDQAVRCRG